MNPRINIGLRRLASFIELPTDNHHLITDPACSRHKAPRPYSRLDRLSRGYSCTPCMVASAYGWAGHD